MIENAERMSCGACGNELFRCYRNEGSVELFVECANTDCKSVSIIKPSATLKTLWTEGSEGVLSPSFP